MTRKNWVIFITLHSKSNKSNSMGEVIDLAEDFPFDAIIAVDPAATKNCGACVLDVQRMVIRSLIATSLEAEPGQQQQQQDNRENVKGKQRIKSTSQVDAAVSSAVSRVVRCTLACAREITSDDSRIRVVVESQIYAAQPVAAIVQGALMGAFNALAPDASVHTCPGPKRDTLVNAVIGDTPGRRVSYDERRRRTVVAVERMIRARPSLMPEPCLSTWHGETCDGALYDVAVAVTMSLREVETSEGMLDLEYLGVPHRGGLPDVGKVRHRRR